LVLQPTEAGHLFNRVGPQRPMLPRVILPLREVPSLELASGASSRRLWLSGYASGKPRGRAIKPSWFT